MSRYDHRDIMMELIDLSRDMKAAIVLQLNYHRASVYKHETARAVEEKIEQLKMIASLIGDDELLDAFRDYDAMKNGSSNMLAPGECPLSKRTLSLLQATDRMMASIANRSLSTSQLESSQFSQNIQNHRRQLLSICGHGSRQWAFFSEL